MPLQAAARPIAAEEAYSRSYLRHFGVDARYKPRIAASVELCHFLAADAWCACVISISNPHSTSPHTDSIACTALTGPWPILR